MQNITQTVRFPVSSLIVSPLDDNQKDLMMKARKATAEYESFVKAGGPVDGPGKELFAAAEAASAALDAATTDKLKKELAQFGAKSLAQDVNVNMQLGTALFDIYSRMSPEPQAPLAKLIWRKRGMELAEAFDAPELKVPDSAMGAIRRALLDESVWTSLSLSAWVDLDPAADGSPRRQYFSVSPKGVKYFSKILEAAAELAYTEDLKDAK